MFRLAMVGGLGGISPTLLRLAIDLTSQNSTYKDINISILLGMALFGALGAGVAMFWGEKDLRKVFYLGLGLPSMLTVATSHISAKPATSMSMLQITSVHAFMPPIKGR